MSQSLILLSLLSFVSCASKIYENKGPINLEVKFKEDSSFYNSYEMEIFIHELRDDCQAELLGRVKAKNRTSTNISLDPGKLYSVSTSIVKESWLSRIDELNNDGGFLIRPNAKEQYLLEVEIEEDAFGRNYYVKGKQKKELKQAVIKNKCEYAIEFRRTW